ncbi:Threonine aspartase 1 isoform X1 [Oopsacas minuta]|uniref:Threonine aspartase 1 isoform X1 n=1 Tax=Oopsacas minuta TaxID=111878 RepID=A0AAV7K396_9METZ|nr:Threonine aspartase 1 isoform X1 [Oopsacas minuta]
MDDYQFGFRTNSDFSIYLRINPALMDPACSSTSRDRREEHVPQGAIAIHTGGGFYSKSLLERIQPYCREACDSGLQQLLLGKSAVEAVTEAIAVLESCSYLNAGIGSNLNRVGLPELDASIMDGNDGSFGSICCCKILANPIRGARLLLDNCRRGVDTNGLVLPLMLSESGIEHFCREKGLRTCSPEDLITEDSYRYFREEIDAVSRQQNSTTGMHTTATNLADTVGAVAVDSTGRTASGCSSGGLLLKHPGRIGPAAVTGCGCYSKSFGLGPSIACCTSGTGEILMRSNLARSYCESVIASPDPDPFTPINKIFSKDVVYNPVYSCYPERYTALIGLFVSEGSGAELIWGHNTPTFVISYQTTCMKKSKFICSKLKSSSLSEAYAISSTRLKFI